MQQEKKIIQTLDIENNCHGIYCNKQFHFENEKEEIENAKFAWCNSPLFEDDKKWTFLNVFLKEQKLEDYSLDQRSLKSTNSQITAQKQAAITAKVDFSESCFYEIMPDHLLHRWFSLREQAMHSVLKSVPKPADYDILHKIHVLVSDISSRPLIVSGLEQRVKYNMFSSATGRLATGRDSYPILNIHKSERSSITPKNDLFLELDLNGAEIRTLLGFSGVEQPDEDVHLWNMKELPPWVERSEAKEKFFAWLYNPKAGNDMYEKFYNKKAYLEHFDGSSIKTPFGRELPVDERKALNYLLQSTTSDIVLDNSYKIMRLLKNKRSNVAFTMHDSVVLDFAKEDHHMVKQIKDIFESNLFGKFLSTINIGKNFGNLKEIKI